MGSPVPIKRFQSITIPLENLGISTDDIFALTGPGFQAETDKILSLFNNLNSHYGFAVYNSIDAKLEMGQKIDRIFAKADKTAIFISTLGEGYKEIADTYRGDTLMYYLVDIIASEFAELSAGYAHDKIKEYALDQGVGYSNRYSPGYCGWSTAGQRELFSFLPQKPCGVELTDTCLMKPVKSVSGAVALGEGIKIKEYNCKGCPDEKCLYRQKFIL